MNNSYTSQVNDYLQGGQARQNGAFANMVPRQTVIGNQPHMLAYINPAEEGMLQEYRNDAPVFAGPDGVPAYGFYEALTGKKFEDTAVGSALGVKSDSTFGSEGSADKAYDFITNDDDLFANIGGDYGDPKPEYDLSGTDTTTTAALPTQRLTTLPTTAAATSELMTPAQVTAYENQRDGIYGYGLDADWNQYFADGGMPLNSNSTSLYEATIAANQKVIDPNAVPWTNPDTGAVTNWYTDGSSDTSDDVVGFIPDDTLVSSRVFGPTTERVTIYKDGGSSEVDAGLVSAFQGMGWSITPPAYTNTTVTTDGSGLMDQLAADTALTNVGTGAAGTGDASTKGFYETATGKKFEDTFAGELIGVTDDSLLGSEGAADAAFTSFTDLVDGGGKGASGDTFEGNGALSNIIASTANALGVSTFDEDAGLAGGEGSVYDVLTDVISPTKIITNVLTGGEGVAGTIGNALEGTAPGEFLEDNIPYIANQLRIDNDSASVDNVLNEIAGGLTGQDAIDATVGYVVNEAIDNAVASNPGSSYDGNVDPDGDGIGTIYIDTNNNQQFDEGENTFASDDIYTDYPMIDYDEDLVGTETIAPITSISGPTRTDRTTDEMLDYTRRYVKDYASNLPEYLRRFTVGEPIDGMFNEFVGEDGKTYYRTAEGEIYDAEKFANAAVGETASVGTGEEIVVGYTETDAEGNSIDYDNEGNQIDGSDERDGYGGVQVPAPFAPPGWTSTEGGMGAWVMTQFWNPETGETYASSNSNERPPEGSPWTSVQPDETPEGGWDFWLPPLGIEKLTPHY